MKRPSLSSFRRSKLKDPPPIDSFQGYVPPKDIHLFVGTRTGHIEKQTAYQEAALHHHDIVHEAPRRQEQKVEAEKAMHQNTMQHYELSHKLAPLQQDNVVRTLEAQTKVIEFAAANNMSVAASDQWQVEDKKADIQLRTAREMADIEVDKSKRLEDNRLAGYEEEVHIDMQAVLAMQMMDVEKLDYMAHKIARLKKENAEPERIAAMERVRVQMERRLLEAGHEEDVEGVDSEADSGAGNREN